VKFPELRPEEFHHPLVRDDAFWVRLITDDRILDLVEIFLGPNLACFTSHYICKPPFDGQPVFWHQDGAYWKLAPMEAVAVWLAIDPSTRENGCLRMVPGSHRQPIVAPKPRTDTANLLYSHADEDLVRRWVDRAGIVDIELAPGDVSVHHPNLLHYSPPNRSSVRRCGLDTGYIATSTVVANEGLYLDPLLVRGNADGSAIVLRKYPQYVEGKTIPFRGHDNWNTKVSMLNSRHQFSDPAATEEKPLVAAQRMIARLREGTVAR
jgi:ectoine hydroxylase-related dioxygenase (phytanoyl-CoA dioxygenase family)